MITEMQPRLSLYDISLEGMLIASILEEAQGELTPEIEARIDRLMAAGPDRVEAAAMVVKSLEANADACYRESMRLLDRTKSFEKQATRLKERMTIAIDAAFSGKVKTPRFTIWTQKAPDSVAFDIREEFTLEMLQQDCPELVRTKLELNKAAAKEMLEAGIQLPEAVFVDEQQGKRYTRIK